MIQCLTQVLSELNCTWGESIVGGIPANGAALPAPEIPQQVSEFLERSIQESPIYSAIESGQLKGLAGKTMAPKTRALLDYLHEYVETRAKEQDRIIVFTQQRDTASFISDIISKDVQLKKLRCAKLTGHSHGPMILVLADTADVCDVGKTKEDNGMSHREQEDTIQKFRGGEYNLLVATSVAEEGLDIGTCNLVIRYDAMTTVTALIQSRGRARHQDSEFVVICMESDMQKGDSLKQLATQESNMIAVVEEIMAGEAPDFEQRLKSLKLERRQQMSNRCSCLIAVCKVRV